MSKPRESKRSGLAADETARESSLQAVVLADSFNKRFRPLTLEKPRCLLPVANTPIIDYTFEFLALAGVQDVIVFCCAHADQIDEYIRRSKWCGDSSPFQSLAVRASPTSMSVGDVMRELDMEGLITSDFLLVSGDIVSNIPLEGVLEAHRQRRAKDKNAIMTMVLRQSSSSHRIRAKGESGIFVLDKTSTRCLQYEEFRGHPKNKMSISTDLLKEHRDVQVRHDLVDCQVDILSPDVPLLFTENFDYQQIRKDFVRGILDDVLYGKTIHCHVIENNYAARVRSLHTYDAVSRDIICRWTYPFCPDSNLCGQTFNYKQGHIYREEGVVLAQSCVIDHRTVIGASTSVGGKTLIKHSVIGRNCKIGKNVVLDGAYIWDNVMIGDNCKVTNAIIGHEAAIHDGVTVEDDAIISYGVVISKGVTIPKKARITRFKREDKSMDDETQEMAVGVGGEGYDYQDSDDGDESDEEDADETGFVYKSPNLNVSAESFSELSEAEESVATSLSTSRLTILSPGGTRHGRRPSQYAAAGEETEQDSFYREAFSSLLHSIEKGHPVEIIALELNSLRMTANAPFSSLRRATAAATMTRIEQLMTGSTQTISKAVEAVIGKLTLLFKRMVFERDDQKDMLLWLQKDLIHRQKGGPIMQASAMKLYEQDILEQEGVDLWWNSPESSKNDDMKRIRAACQQFIDFLQESEDEDDDDDDEEENE